MKKNSLVIKLTLHIALLVTIITAIVLTISGWLLHRQAMRTLEVMQEIEAHELADLLEKNPSLTSGQIKHRFENHADSDIALYFIQVRNLDDGIFYRSANLGESIIGLSPNNENISPKIWTISIPGAGSVLVYEITSGPWRIQVGTALEPVDRILRSFSQLGGVLLIITMIVSILLGYAFSRMTITPIRIIESTARRIRADNLSERIQVPPGYGEITALATLLNHTFDHLESAFVQSRRFTADASHELKTPLALIRLHAEKLRAKITAGSVPPDPETDALAADLLEETDRMQYIIESLLFMAKVDSGTLTLPLHPQDMPVFINEFAEDASVLAEDRDIYFKVGHNDSGTARIEPHSLRRLLLNLTSNAIAASAPGTTITLDSEKISWGWRLILTDEGPGIPPEMLGSIFERFTRHAPSTTGTGHGLGLAISRSIAELHSGTIRAENRTDRSGLRVIFEWRTK